MTGCDKMAILRFQYSTSSSPDKPAADVGKCCAMVVVGGVEAEAVGYVESTVPPPLRRASIFRIRRWTFNATASWAWATTAISLIAANFARCCCKNTMGSSSSIVGRRPFEFRGLQGGFFTPFSISPFDFSISDYNISSIIHEQAV